MLTKARIGMAVGAVIAGSGIGIAGAYMLGLMPGSGSETGIEAREGGPGGPFTLTAHTGETVTDETFRGRYLLVFFGFTFCPDACPTTLADISAAMRALGDDAAAVQPLFISVDPGRDTPDLLASYLSADAFDDRIVGLTGSEEQVAAAAKAYNAWYEIVPDENDPEFYLVNHTAAVYFLDPLGRFVRVFSYQTPTEEMVESIRATMRADAAA